MVTCQKDHHNVRTRLKRVYPDSSGEEEVQIYKGLPWSHTKQKPESKSICFHEELQHTAFFLSLPNVTIIPTSGPLHVLSPPLRLTTPPPLPIPFA